MAFLTDRALESTIVNYVYQTEWSYLGADEDASHDELY